MIRKSLIAASLFGLALSASQPAFAGTRSVGYADLDLSTDAGNAKLDARLKSAARTVCDFNRKFATAADYAISRRCFIEAYANARRAKSTIQQTTLAAR